ncbi:hypothetical protein EMMF5_003817 [Cystobasidiomycetes sp. EMM_F5]
MSHPTTQPQPVEAPSATMVSKGEEMDVATDKPAGPPAQTTVLEGKQLVFAFTGMMLAIFLIALDQTILATALPEIVTTFNSLDSVTWVSGGFILAQTGLMTTFGQVTALYVPKYVFISAIIVFEIGSLLAGVAPNIDVLILGRAITGAGAAGLMVSMITIMTEMIPLHKRAAYMGIFGSVFGLASVVGPLIALAAAVFLVKKSTPPAVSMGDKRNGWQRMLSIDWVGTVLVLGCVTALVFATTYGPNRGWNNGGVIACLVVCGSLAILTVAWEWYLGDKAMIPLSLFKNRSFCAVIGSQVSSRWVMLVPVYYLPIYFQAVKNHSATTSGLDLLGVILSLIVTGTIVGIIVRKTGKYVYFIIAGPLLSVIGLALLFTVKVDTSFANILGYEILVGVGIGLYFQMGMLAAQAEFAKERAKMSRAMGVTTGSQMLGGIVGLAIAGAVFDQKLANNLEQFAPGVPAIVANAPTALRQYVSGSTLDAVILSYVNAVKYTFIVCVPIAGISAIVALFIKNRPMMAPGAPPAGKKPEDVEKQSQNPSERAAEANDVQDNDTTRRNSLDAVSKSSSSSPV